MWQHIIHLSKGPHVVTREKEWSPCSPWRS